MPNRLRFRLISVLSLLILGVAAYGIWWWRLAHLAEDNLGRWVAAQTQAGWSVATGPVALSGFPFDLRLTLPNPAIADAAGNSWRGPAVTVILPPLRPDLPRLEAPGHHDIVWAGHPPISLDAGTLNVALGIAAGGPERVDLDATEATVNGNHIGHLTTNWRQLKPGPVPHTEASMSLDAAVTDVTLAAAPAPWMDRQIANGQISARLMGALTGTNKEAIAAWSEDGGTIEADSFTLNWPPARLDGKFSLALDSALQPLLSGTTTAQGLDQVLAKMAAARALTANQAMIGQFALAALAKSNSNGAITLPVTIQNQMVALGPIVLLRLPPLKW